MQQATRKGNNAHRAGRLITQRYAEIAKTVQATTTNYKLSYIKVKVKVKVWVLGIAPFT